MQNSKEQIRCIMGDMQVTYSQGKCSLNGQLLLQWFSLISIFFRRLRVQAVVTFKSLIDYLTKTKIDSVSVSYIPVKVTQTFVFIYVFFFVFEQASAELATMELSRGPKLAATNCRCRLLLQGVLKLVPIFASLRFH